jgi:hypothetical protein
VVTRTRIFITASKARMIYAQLRYAQYILATFWFALVVTVLVESR